MFTKLAFEYAKLASKRPKAKQSNAQEGDLGDLGDLFLSARLNLS